MISAQTLLAFVARENRCTLFRIMLQWRQLLSAAGPQGGIFKRNVAGFQGRTLHHKPESASALGALILPQDVPVPRRLDADEGSLEIAGDADRCSSHVRRLFPVMVVE
jgi:hypothetical protein